MSVAWNPWHGCSKYSEGCLNCYVYRIDAAAGRESRQVSLNSSFNLPEKSGRSGMKIKSGDEVYTCLSSDFFIEEADKWRPRAWEMMAARRDLTFIIITKRITRMHLCLPDDWGNGRAYSHIHIGCTCENQRRADERLPVFLSLPIVHRFIVCEPLLEKINLRSYLDRRIEKVIVGGESGEGARVCDYDWVLSIRDDCAATGTAFHFKQTGANFRKGGRVYVIPRKYQLSQARAAGIDLPGSVKESSD